MGGAPAVRGRAVVAVLLAVQFMLILDVAVVSVANPQIQQGLRIPAGDLQWTTTAYTVTFGGLLVVAGRACDILGRRRFFLAGTALFTLSSALCGLAQRDWQLFAARAVQGIGAAVVSPAALSLLTTSFADPEKRNRVMGLWGAVASGGAVAGQLVGGVLTDVWGWRWVFLINLPVGVLAMLAGRYVLPRDEERRTAALDTTGALVLTLGTVLAVFGIGRTAEHALDAVAVVSFAAAVVLLALFVRQERRHGDPLVRFGIFRNRSLVGGNVVSVLNAAAALTTIFFASLYMQHVLNYSPFVAGLAFAPVTLAILGVSALTVRLVAAFGVRVLLAAGAVLTGAGLLALCAMAVDGSYWTTVLPGLMLLGIGQGLGFAPGMIAATSGVSDDEQGLASGLVTTSQQLGGAVGFAILTSLAAAALPGPDSADPVVLIHSYRVGYLAGLVVPALALVAALALTGDRTAGPASTINSTTVKGETP
jgi:EmrB/QacA subfamily drug resistance transporter